MFLFKLWDLFKLIVEKYKADDRIMERHFRFVYLFLLWFSQLCNFSRRPKTNQGK